MAIELVEHDIGLMIALNLKDHAHAQAVGLVAVLGNAFDHLFGAQQTDPLHYAGLVDLIGDFGDDNGFAVFADLFDFRLGAQHNGAATERVSRLDTTAPQNLPGGGKVWARHDLHQRLKAHLRVMR